MRKRAGFIALGLAMASPVQAQSADDFSDEDTLASKSFTTPGGAQAVAHGMLLAMKLEQKVMDYCWEYGCLVIVNETNRFKVTGFHVGETRRNGELRWGPNQFGRALDARKATFRFKTGKTDCQRPVQFVLRDPKSKEVVKIEDRADLCSTPHVDSLLRINVVRPRVIVGEE